MKIILSMKSNIVGVNIGQVINWLKVCAALHSSLATVISEYSLFLLLNWLHSKLSSLNFITANESLQDPAFSGQITLKSFVRQLLEG